jgi:hypothetical protein
LFRLRSIVAEGDIVINDTNHDLNLVIDNKSGVIKSDNNITIHAKTLVILLAVMLKSCLALITDELLNNSSDK